MCESGIDLAAYALTRPPHDTVNIGWAGPHAVATRRCCRWLAQVAGVMRARPVTNFVSIGEPYGDVLAESGAVAPERCLSIPLVLPEQLPAAMSIFDIAFDPLGKQPWRRARSPLRWLEAAAWGIPFVGDPRHLPADRARRDRLPRAHARTSSRRVLLALVDDAATARRGRRAGRARVVEERYSMDALAPRWQEALA